MHKATAIKYFNFPVFRSIDIRFSRLFVIEDSLSSWTRKSRDPLLGKQVGVGSATSAPDPKDPSLPLYFQFRRTPKR